MVGGASFRATAMPPSFLACANGFSIDGGEGRAQKGWVNATALRDKLADWFLACGRDLPWRGTRDPYAVLVSEMMLQQTQVAAVVPYFVRWMQRFPTVAKLAAAGEEEVLGAWAGLGYYARARSLHRAAKLVLEQHGGGIPGEREAVEALPGVGRYTAGAVLSFAFDQPVAAVDANIARVLARLFNVRMAVDSARGQARIWSLAEDLLPGDGGRLHNSALMELGTLVCLPRQPRCEECPVRAHCAAPDPQKLPIKKPRRKVVEMEENCVWDFNRRGVMLELQEGRRWKGMWKLPMLERRGAGAPVLEDEYPFTHHRVKLRVYAQRCAGGGGARRISLARLAVLPMVAAHGRAVHRLLSVAGRGGGGRGAAAEALRGAATV